VVAVADPAHDNPFLIFGFVSTGRRLGVCSPLLSAAITGWVRQGAWAVLVFLAFVAATVASVSAPMFSEASANAVFADRRAAVPPNAGRKEDAVVRLTASVSPRSADQQAALRELAAIPNLTPPRIGGSSIRAELAVLRSWASAVTLNGRSAPVRLFAADDPAARVVPVATAPVPDGVWLPQPTADELAARPGDTVTYSVKADGTVSSVEVRVAGVYATTGRLPADPAGGRSWSVQRSDLPVDPGARTLPGFLLIGDPATIERLADATGDQMLWWADADLVPGVTLAGARETARQIARLKVRYAQFLAGNPNAVLAPRVTSGINMITSDAVTVSAAVDRRIRTVEWAAIAIGLASVLAVGLLSVRRRRIELRHGVGTGVPPLAVGSLWFVEHLGPAVLAGAAGWVTAWSLVRWLGPGGAVTVASVTPALVVAGLVALVGSLVVAGSATVTAARWVRPVPPVTPSRPRAWVILIVVAAGVAVVGLWGTTQARGIDLAVPMLVLAALGALGGSALIRAAGLRRRGAAAPGRADGAPRAGGAAPLTGAGPQRWVVGWLVRRRLAAGGERRLTITVLTTGLGMLAFALCAVASVAAVADDRIAVDTGAEVVAEIGGSWLLDPDAVYMPPDPEPPGTPPSEGLVPGVRTPPLPADATLVWRIDAETTLDYGLRDLVVVNPEQLLRVASWGHGDDLAAARRAVRQLAAIDPATALPGRDIPAIVVGDPTVAGSEEIPVNLGPWSGRLDVIAELPVFPGLGQVKRPMYVVPDLVTFTRLGMFDPRLHPRGRSELAPLTFRTFVWTSAGGEGLTKVLGDLQPQRVDTAATARQRPPVLAAARSRGYQLAVVAYLALLAVISLCVYSERTASASRPGDLMLARVGVGRARVVRARAAELAALVGASLACAVGGLAVLAPLASRLLDDEPGRVPVLRLTVPAEAIVITIAAAVVATAAATALALLRGRSREEEAYRDE
jgi:putative ABC transport system permease protein